MWKAPFVYAGKLRYVASPYDSIQAAACDVSTELVLSRALKEDEYAQSLASMRSNWLGVRDRGLVLSRYASFTQPEPSSEQGPAPDAVVIRILTVIILVAANYGIWLIPVIPVAIYEMSRSHSLRRAALSAVIVWSAAMVSYYAYYAFMLMAVSLPNMEFMLFSNRRSATYWADMWPPFRRVIVAQFAEWIVIAVIGGAMVGTLSAYVYHLLTKRGMQRE